MSIEIGQTIVLKIPQELVTESWLSVPGWDKLKYTNGFCRDNLRAADDPAFAMNKQKLPFRSYNEEACLFPYYAHLEKLGLSNSIPWLMTGARNLGNNLRIVGWKEHQGLLELNGENATNGRQYSCLLKKNDGLLTIERLTFHHEKPNLDNIVWATSGQELVWEGEPVPIERIIPYTYDLRHVWDIPGHDVTKMGSHPYRGDYIEEMCDLFVKTKDLTTNEAALQLTQLAEKRGYKRKKDYLHSAMGITQDGSTIIIVQRHGAFEDISQALVSAGAWRAIELDQGGSCAVITRGESDEQYGHFLSAGYYYRPRGLAFLVFGVRDTLFKENSSLL